MNYQHRVIGANNQRSYGINKGYPGEIDRHISGRKQVDFERRIQELLNDPKLGSYMQILTSHKLEFSSQAETVAVASLIPLFAIIGGTAVYSAAEKKYGDDVIEKMLDKYPGNFINSIFPTAAANKIPNEIKTPKTNKTYSKQEVPVTELGMASYFSPISECVGKITAGIDKYIEDKLQFKFPFSEFYDADRDAIKNARDPHPKEHEDKYTDSDLDGLTDWDEKHVYGTDHRSIDSDGDGLNDNEEINIVHTDPKNPDTDRDGYSDLKDKHPLNPDDVDHDGLLDGMDADNDGMSNWFERNIAGLDPLTPNDRYVMLSTEGYGAGNIALQNIHKYVTESHISNKTIINLKGDWGYPIQEIPKKYSYIDNLTFTVFEHGANQIAENSDEHDLVYVMLHGSGLPGDFYFQPYGEGTPYEEIDNLLDKINAKAMIVTIDACHSGSAIPHLKDGPCPRIVMTQCRVNQSAGNARLAEYFFEGLDNEIADKDGNNYVSVKEAFEYAKRKIMSEWFIKDNDYKPSEPQISDPDNIASKLYLGEHKPENKPEK